METLLTEKISWVFSRSTTPREEAMEWLPMISHNNIWVGVSRAGRWMISPNREQGPVASIHLKKGPYSLALLEFDISTLKNALGQSLQMVPYQMSDFPYDSIIECGIFSRSRYWIDLSLKWCEADGVSDYIIRALKKCIDSNIMPHFSQRIRRIIINSNKRRDT